MNLKEICKEKGGDRNEKNEKNSWLDYIGYVNDSDINFDDYFSYSKGLDRNGRR